MTGFWTKRRFMAAAFTISTAGGLTLWAQVPATSPGVSTRPSTLPATMLEPTKPIAEIDGQLINNATFYNLLMQEAGVRVFQQVFDNVIVAHACTVASIPTRGTEGWPALYDAEMQRVLDGISVKGATLTKDDKFKILDESVRRQGMSPAEFIIKLETNAGLRALVKGQVDVSDKEIKDYYDVKYGAKAFVRLVQVGSDENAAALRSKVETQKKSLERAAQELNLQVQSLTVPESAKELGPLRTAAFANKIGELSPRIEYNNLKWMLLVDDREESQVSKTTLDSVKASLRTEIYSAKENKMMEDRLARLRADNLRHTTINDPTLRAEFAALNDIMVRQAQAAQAAQDAAAAAATQSETGAATRGATSATRPK